jgi:glycine/D-amino acid oxidase-like deaminating enzyme
MSADLRVLVVGAGIIGASIAYYLSQYRSVEVTVCEQQEVGRAGATAKSGGLIRELHMSDVDLRIAAAAVPLMRDLASEHPGPGRFRRTGFAFVTQEKNRALLESHVEQARQAGIQIALRDSESVRTEYPDLRLRETDVIALEHSAGYAAPAEIAACLTERAAARGARILPHSKVSRLSAAEGGRIAAELPDRQLQADVVVLANGVRSHHLAATVDVHVPIRARPIGTATVAVAGPGPVRAPLVIDDTLGTYYRPDGASGVLFGVDPDTGDTGSEAAELDRQRVLAARDVLSERLPRLASAMLVRSRLGFDAYTPDRRPLVGWSGQRGLYLATGMSGGGFKLAAGVGRAVADEIVTGNQTAISIAYRPERFAVSAAITSDYVYSTV